MNKYVEQIQNAQTIKKIDQIIETAAWDEELTNEQYIVLYATALTKAQNFTLNK